MFKKRYVAAAACALAMVGTANAVQVSRDGTGDFLIAPAYFIGGGMTTDLKVVNTSATQSVVAKVVFRDQVTSAEVLDFLIYLSPSDVWTGNVSCAEADPNNGQCIRSLITSTDDSIQLEGREEFASPANPAIIVSDNRTAGETGRVVLPNQGYVEVIMGTAYNIPNDKKQFGPGVLKKDIYERHMLSFAAGGFVAPENTPDVLMGSVTANVPGLGGATLPMLALAGYDNSENVFVGNVSGFDLPSQRTPIHDVEEALWTNNIAIPYAAGAGKISLATFTFPTKLAYNNRTDGQYPFAEGIPATATTPRIYGKTCINAAVFDNSENSIRSIPNVSPLPERSACLNEFQWLIFGAGADVHTGDFEEGWARITFRSPAIAQAQLENPADTTNLGRSGVPAIVTYMIKDHAANKFTWAYASSTR